MQELREREPGGFLVAQQLATMMLVQALAAFGGRIEGRCRVALRAGRSADECGDQRDA